MPYLSDNYFTKEAIFSMIKSDNIDGEYIEDFFTKLQYEIQEHINEEGIEEESVFSAAFNWVSDYYHKYIILVKNGHGHRYASLVAASIEGYGHPINDAYDILKAEDSSLADQELTIHCKALGGDELYISFFIEYVRKGGYYTDENPEEKAAKYSAIYKAEILKGKNDSFAKMYAEMSAHSYYNDVYNFVFSNSYDLQIQNGKSQEFAKRFAALMAEYYSNNYSDKRHLGNNTEHDNFNDDTVAASMLGWEYAKENKLERPVMFSEIYSDVFMRKMSDANLIDENFQAEILENALRMYQNNKNLPLLYSEN